MNMYQNSVPFSQPQQTSKYIDSQKIYPKRLGTYQNGHALVLEYYNLATDKFKKHLIPLDRQKSVKQNIDAIYKNPKHGVLLRKVEPKYVQSVIKGESSMTHKSSTFNQQFSSSSNNQSHINNYSSQYSQQPSYSNQNEPSSSQLVSQYNSLASNKQNYNQQNSVSSIIDPKSSYPISQQVKQKIQQVQEYYDQQFQDFQISQSMGKKNNNLKGVNTKKQPVGDLSINSNQGNQSVSIPLQSKYNHGEQGQKIEQKKEKKQKKSKKSKDGKKSKKKKQQPQQQQFQFDFLDGDGDEKVNNKKTTKPRQTQKQKTTKTKEKSKQKDKSVKKDKKQQKIKIQQKPIKPVVQQVIEEDFDFDL